MILDIVVDVQKDFITGALANPQAQANVAHLAETVKAHARAGHWLFLTRDTHPDNYLATREGRHLPVEHCIEGEDGWNFAPELENALDGTEPEVCHIVNKPTFGSYMLPQTVKKAHCRGEHCSPVTVRLVRSLPKRALLRQVGGRTMFAPTFSTRQSRCFLTYCGSYMLPSEILDELMAHNKAVDDIEKIVIYGYCTDICVISNAMVLRAAFPETEIEILSDCCAGVTPQSHQTALDAMRACQFTIV